MPRSALTPCRHPGCAAVLDTPGYCQAHRADRRQWDNPARKRQRQQSRALPTNSAAWRALRAQVLFDEPLCRECQRQGVVTPASVVDHVDGDSHNNERSNLAPTCASCHSLLTAKHDGGFGNARRAR